MKLFKSLKTLCLVTTFLVVLAEDLPKFKEAKAATYRYSIITNDRWEEQCLDLPTQGNGRSGTLVQSWACNGWDNQKWIIENLNGTDVRIRNYKYRDQCLDLPTQGNGRSGTLVQTWACNGWSNQRWVIVSWFGQTYKSIRNVGYPSTRQYLDLPTQGNGRSGTLVQSWAFTGVDNQRWKIRDIYF